MLIPFIEVLVKTFRDVAIISKKTDRPKQLSVRGRRRRREEGWGLLSAKSEERERGEGKRRHVANKVYSIAERVITELATLGYTIDV